MIDDRGDPSLASRTCHHKLFCIQRHSRTNNPILIYEHISEMGSDERNDKQVKSVKIISEQFQI